MSPLSPGYYLTHYNLGFLLVFATSLLVSLLVTPLMRAVAHRFGAIDQPSARKVHHMPIPRLGGVAICIGFLVVVLAAARGLSLARPANINPNVVLSDLTAILLAGLLVALAGFLDDRSGGQLPPGVKFAFQVAAAAVLVTYGIQMHVFPPGRLNALNVVLTILWVAGLSNAMNLLDNMDGLSAGTAAIAGFFFFVLAILNGQVLVATLALALCGSCLGFLRYNYRAATIFMGDTGSLFLGFLLATLGLKLRLSTVDGEKWGFALAVLVLALPIFDTSLVTIHRFLAGRPITQGGKDHTSHRLVNLGLSPGHAVQLLYGVSVGVGVVALILVKVAGGAILLMALPVGALALLAGLYLGRVPIEPTRPTRPSAP